MANEVTANTITIKRDDAEYIFRVPSVKDDIRVGQAARLIRADLDPNGYGGEDGLDQRSVLTSRYLAVFEVLLEKSSATWIAWKVAKKGADTTTVFDSDAVPADRADDIIDIGIEFDNEVIRFRESRTGNGKPPGTETVAGQPLPE